MSKLKKRLLVSELSGKNKQNKLSDPNQEVCPICGMYTGTVYKITEAQDDTALWYSCNCGVIFQNKKPDLRYYRTDKAITRMKELLKAPARYTHEAHVYMPAIEDMLYGRTLLEVGYGTLDNLHYFHDRGWLAWGIDMNPNAPKAPYTYTGNFETFDFHAPLRTPEIIKETGDTDAKREFSVIWLSNVLQCFHDPIKALKKCFTLLPKSGIIFISTPCVDFIQTLGLAGFPHWKKHEHYIMWKEEALCRELRRIGFKVVLSTKKYHHRASTNYILHIIAQKAEV